MKTFIVVLLAWLTLLGDFVQATPTADARMYCLSVRFGHAQAGGPNALYSLDLTGINFGINGELYPVFGAPRTHFTSLILTDDLFDEEYEGSMLLNVPTTDINGDGFPDFFDTALGFSGSSSGTYSFPGIASGNAGASWSRNAGSYVGTCQLNFVGFGSFTHSFNILEYRGPLAYTPGTNVVTGNVDLTLTGVPDYELKGPIAFTKSATNPYNELTLQTGTWTNNTEQMFFYYDYPFLRDVNIQTNYYGYFLFDDWNLDTAEEDYYVWVLSVDDRNDADSDTIPDFSDDPQNVSPRRPLLALNRAPGNLLLTISSDVGQLCEIQEAAIVNATNWPTILSVTLTNDPQTISLPLPSQTKFWRVRVP